MRIERQASAAAKWSSRIVSFALILMLTAAAAHRFGFIETVPFFWSLVLVGSLALIAFATGMIALWQMWQHGLTGLRAASRGVFLSVLLLVPYGVATAHYTTYPPLTDVMTNVVDPPQFVYADKLRHGPMNPVIPISQVDGLVHIATYPDLTTRRYEHAREQVVAAVLVLFERRGWALLTAGSPQVPGESSAPVTLEAAAQTLVLGIPFDVAVRVEDRADATYVDMRSVSRYGSHDLGINADQMRSFLQDLDLILTEAGNV